MNNFGLWKTIRGLCWLSVKLFISLPRIRTPVRYVFVHVPLLLAYHLHDMWYDANETEWLYQSLKNIKNLFLLSKIYNKVIMSYINLLIISFPFFQVS